MSKVGLAVLGVAAVAIVGGYFAFVAPNAAQAPVEAAAPPAPPPRPLASDCPGLFAVYAHRATPEVRLRMESGGSYTGPAALARQFSNTQAGALTFVLETPSGEKRYALLKSLGYTQNYLFPIDAENTFQTPSLADLILVSFFDETYGYFPNPPVEGTAAAEHVFAPGIARQLHPASGRGGDMILSMDMFDFVACADPREGAAETSPAP